ncbi:MAG: AAA family ATPase [Alphaproteobacteria bacterium]|nr:AAA family ATPase [Alphaproteobacteria bacterium]
MSIIGRLEEQKKLQKALDSKEAEFIAIYGRRRVGKTFLIKEFFSKQKCSLFQITGIYKAPLKAQLNEFKRNIQETFGQKTGESLFKSPNNWMDALAMLDFYINQNLSQQKIVLFFDEFPWMATKKSGLKSALGYYWNRYWSTNPNVKLVICGSSASWIIHNILKDKGGLHNRVTLRIALDPFTLAETKLFLNYRGIHLSNNQILDIYMCLGGIPFYLKGIEKGLSAVQNIQNLCFSKNGLLWNEFDSLFAALFENGPEYEKLIKIIGKKRYGISRKDLVEKTGYGGKTLSSRLKSLEETGFITSFISQERARGVFYKVIDEYSLFYLFWVLDPLTQRPITPSEHFFEGLAQSPSWYTWAGYAFEAVCYKHLAQIREKLYLPINSIAYTWRHTPSKEEGTQIDLLFDRPDHTITLCEMKYSKNPVIVDKSLVKELERKASIYKKATKTEKDIFFALITASAIQSNAYSNDYIASHVDVSALF